MGRVGEGDKVEVLVMVVVVVDKGPDSRDAENEEIVQKQVVHLNLNTL